MSKLKKDEFIARFGEDAWKEEVRKRSTWNKKWRNDNRETLNEHRRKYASENRGRINGYKKTYCTTQSYRASNLYEKYRVFDVRFNKGDCTITQKWILENIFTSSCTYCGETDWRKLGCDRIDNNLPHTPDNVVCSCRKCNTERQRKPFDEFIREKRLDNQPLF